MKKLSSALSIVFLCGCFAAPLCIQATAEEINTDTTLEDIEEELVDGDEEVISTPGDEGAD